MSRRHILIAVLAALCLLFAGCSGLTLTSRTSSLVIPLKSAARNAVQVTFGQNFCDHYEFKLYNNSVTLTASGTDTIVFNDIPFGTYTLEGKAIGILVDGNPHVIATSLNENVVINSTEQFTVNIVFTLEAIDFNDSDTSGDEYIEYTQDAQDSSVTKTVYSDESKSTKVSETEDQADGTRIVRDYGTGTDNNHPTTVTETKPDTTVIVTNYSAGTTRKTTQTETTPKGTEIVREYKQDTNNRKEYETETQTNGTVIIRSFDTNNATNYQTGETETRSNGTVLVTQFSSGLKTTQKETTASNVFTVRTYTNSSANPLALETKYQTGWDPDGTHTDPNTYHVARTVEYAYSGTTLTQTTTTDYDYTGSSTYNVNGIATIPYEKKTTKVCDGSGNVISTAVTTYTYTGAGKPSNISTVKNGTEVAYERYTYKTDDSGSPDTITTCEEGEEPKYFAFRPIGLKIYSDTAMTGTVIFQSTGSTFFECPCTDDTFSDPDASQIPEGKIFEYLTDHYVVVGSSIYEGSETGNTLDDLNFIQTSQITTAHNAGFKYIFKVDFQGFIDATNSGCFKKGSVVSEGSGINQCFYLKCYLHNDKNGCTNFWGTQKNFATAKDKYLITTTNYGCAVGGNYPGNGQGI